MSREDPRTDEELLAATASDPDAFAAFYRRHLRTVLAYLIHRTGRRELAADLAAETFAAALEGARRFSPLRPGGARGWLFTIAAHKVADSARHGRVVSEARRAIGMPVRDLADDDLERAEELLDAERMAGDLRALLADLPEGQREALLARIVDERDYPEIARELQCSEAVVRQRVSRSLGHLRSRMGDLRP